MVSSLLHTPSSLHGSTSPFIGRSLPLRRSFAAVGAGDRCFQRIGQTQLSSFKLCTIHCRLAKPKESASSPTHDSLVREPHKYFDQVAITVRAGDGGHGAVLSLPQAAKTGGRQGKEKEKPKGGKRGSFKRDFDGSLILPIGGHGGDVVVCADEGKDSLLEFHQKGRHNAKRGGNVDAMGVLTSQLRNGFDAPTLRISVPVG